MLGFSHKTLETSLFKVSENSGTVATHFPYSVQIALCEYSLKPEQTRTKLKSTAVISCDTRKILCVKFMQSRRGFSNTHKQTPMEWDSNNWYSIGELHLIMRT